MTSRLVATDVIVASCGALDQFGEPEVEHLGAPVARDDDVRGLDVAVDDPFGVRGLRALAICTA